MPQGCGNLTSLHIFTHVNFSSLKYMWMPNIKKKKTSKWVYIYIFLKLRCEPQKSVNNGWYFGH